MTPATGRHRGLTLLELVVVITILAILAGMVVPMLAGTQEQAQVEAAKAGVAELRNALLGGSAAGLSGGAGAGAEVPGFKSDTRQLPLRMGNLFFNPFAAGEDYSGLPELATWKPVTRLGWRGPYIRNPSGRYADTLPVPGPTSWTDPATAVYARPGDPAMVDPWGRPYVLQLPSTGDAANRFLFARVVSAGPDGVLALHPDATAATIAAYVSAGTGDDVIAWLNSVPPQP